MTLFDFLKKQKRKKIAEPKRKISLSQIEDYLKNKESENKLKEEKVFEFIQEKINNFIMGIRGKINIAKSIDIDPEKAEDKLKFLTDMGREKYLESVENFIQDLENLQKKDFKRFFEDMDRIFLNFYKSSRGNYERATILIGKEMDDIREHLKNFSKDLTKIFEQNKEIIELYIKISVLRQKLKKINESKETLKKLNEEIVLLDKKITESEKETEKILEEIEKTKKSEDYLKNLKIKERIRLVKIELDKSILDLRQLIDFKALAGFFHIFEDSMEIVKAYRNDFRTTFKKDYGDEILRLLNEAKLNNEFIEKKINEIKNKKEEIINYQKNFIEDSVEVLLSKIEKIKENISELNKEKDRKNKISEKLKMDKEQLKREIKEELKKMDVVVEEEIN